MEKDLAPGTHTIITAGYNTVLHRAALEFY